jgi:hypothetical protein
VFRIIAKEVNVHPKRDWRTSTKRDISPAMMSVSQKYLDIDIEYISTWKRKKLLRKSEAAIANHPIFPPARKYSSVPFPSRHAK